MSPKYILVLLLALVFAATSLATNPPIRGGSKPPHHGPTEEASLQEQENSQVNNHPYPPRKGHPPEQDNSEVNNQPHKPPHGPPHKPTTEELSQEEKENSELNAYPPRKRKGHPPKEDNSQVNAYPKPHKPPHEPPQKPTTEELSHEVNTNPGGHRKRTPPKEDNSHLDGHIGAGPPHKQGTEELPRHQQQNVKKVLPSPGHGHPHVVEEDQKGKRVDNTQRTRLPHHPPTPN